MKKQIYLLQEYNNKNRGEIISVNKDIAEMLINKSIGRYATNKDFLVKPAFGISKAFKKCKFN